MATASATAKAKVMATTKAMLVLTGDDRLAAVHMSS